MPKPQVIGPVPLITPSARGQRRALPDDLLREASRRLGIIALLGAGLWAIGTIMDHFADWAMSHWDPRWLDLHTPDAIAGATVLVSLALFFYARKNDRDPRFVLDLGLGYMVLMALALGLMFHWKPIAAGWPGSPTISWIGAVLLIFAAIVPSTPERRWWPGCWPSP